MKEPVSKFDEPEPGATSGVRARQMSVDWNSVKQLAAILGLYAATLFVLDATASPVAFGGGALHGPCRWVLRRCQLRCWLRLCPCSQGSARRPLVWRKILRV